MSIHIKLKCILIAAAAVIMAGSAAQATPVIPPGFSAIVLDANINQGINTITQITTFTITTTSTGYGRYSTASPGANEFFALVPPQGGVVTSAFAAGVVNGLPGDPAGSAINHLVVFGNFTPAELSLNFAALFPGLSESAFINDLLTTPGNVSLPFADVSAFTNDAKALGLYGGDGASFEAVAFSDGTVIGNGIISILPKTARVPEPMTITLFGTALAGLATVRRRRKRS